MKLRREGLIAFGLALALGWLTGCGSATSPTSQSPTAPSTSSLIITGTVPEVQAGDPDFCSGQAICLFAGMPAIPFSGPSASFSDYGLVESIILTARASVSGSGNQDVTTQAAWSSSDTTIATVSSTGVLRLASGYGSADISAVFQGTAGKLTVSRVPFPCVPSGRRVVGNPYTNPDQQDLMNAKPAGGSYTLQFTITQSGTGSCAWVPATYVGWLHAAGSGNVGDGTVTVNVDASAGPRLSVVLLNFSGLNLVDASRIKVLFLEQGFSDVPQF